MQKAPRLRHFGNTLQKGLFVPVEWIFLGLDAGLDAKPNGTASEEKAGF